MLKVVITMLCVMAAMTALTLSLMSSSAATWAAYPVWDRSHTVCPLCGYEGLELYLQSSAKPTMALHCPHCHSWRYEKIVPRAEAE